MLCFLVLTRLASCDAGAIFAKWTKGDNSVTWRFTPQVDFLFEVPQDTTKILQIDDQAVFSSMLARIGFGITGETYLGAGTCEGEPIRPNRFATVFSNQKQTGYWIKLQTIPRVTQPTDSQTRTRLWDLVKRLLQS